MIEDGRAFGNTVATKHLLRLLVQNGVISRADVTKLHEDAQAELQAIVGRGAMSPDEGAKGARAIGYLYVLD